MKKPVVLDGYQTLRGTNFKPDRDLSKVNSFGTMYDHFFVPKMNSDFQRAGSIHNTYESHLPKGSLCPVEFGIHRVPQAFSYICTHMKEYSLIYLPENRKKCICSIIAVCKSHKGLITMISTEVMTHLL
jgi:hypothetical protein